MEEENQRGHDAAVRLPLHPRKAQELFFELLHAGPSASCSDSETATSPRDTPTPRSFQQRLARSQQYCTDALKVLQRGQWVRSLSKRPTADTMVQLRLSPDGAKLQAYAFAPRASGSERTDDSQQQQQDHDQDQSQGVVTCVDAVDVASLRSLVVVPSTCFALRTAAAQGDSDDASLFQSPFQAESDDVLACIAVAVASTVSAQRDKTANQQDALLWQAVRLRIVELVASGEPPLHDAIAAMEAAYDALRARETHSALPARGTLFFLRAG